MNGVIKKVNKTRGYGFITAEGGRDLFFHYSDLVEISIEKLEIGTTVEFIRDYGPRGLIEIKIELAAQVKVVGV